ncbi:hypothetical protein [Candidatus Methylomirabilis sp.]|uniref:SMODS-associated NUDIX domain-containing protein n=1 Tax=Candidatus Methylomirabilis sp. TaxID=2032687 RepID=UPI003076809D
MDIGAIGIHLGVLALERLSKARLVACRVWRPNAELRVSLSALLRISDGGRFLLIRNYHRPELFGPVGGVYKYYDDARVQLDEVSFRPQDVGRGDDMRNDLRGFLPRRYAPQLIKWYEQRTLRESPEACLLRELREELREVKLVSRVSPPAELPLRPVRTVREGPERVPGQAYTQYRVFEVFDIATNATAAADAFRRLFEIAAVGHDHLLIATSDEIVAGRARNGRRIGSHTAYLIRRSRVLPPEPPFTS